jgi:hypothetical protein
LRERVARRGRRARKLPSPPHAKEGEQLYI